MHLTTEFKQNVREALLDNRQNFGGSDAEYAKSKGINAAIYSRLKGGEIDRVLSDTVWITLGRDLQVNTGKNNWKIVRTSVYAELEDSLRFCKQFSKSMIFVDECDIGKSTCARHILKGMKNAFYHDCSQTKTKQQFIRALAKLVGLDSLGKYNDVKANLKYYLNTLEEPIIVLDEAGDLEYTAFLEVKELWNGTAGACAWYMIGADGLKTKIDNGFKNKKVGFAEIISRFSDEFIHVVPKGSNENRKAFFKQLLTDVAVGNLNDPAKASQLVRTCLDKDKKLRHLDTIIKLGDA